MDSIEILGGKSLDGEITIQGSKNAALPMLAAAILNQGVTVLHNCPKIIDVFYMIKILEYIGCKVRWEGSSVFIDAKNLISCDIPEEYANKMRSSIILSGALLSRLKRAVIPFPGGCVIGKRPIDIHLAAFREMNINIREQEDGIMLQTDEITGDDIILRTPSVGATENVILAAVCAKGTTKIVNAAKEPEIIELAKLLVCMGAKIEGLSTNEIIIHGVEKLHDTEYTIVADRIAAGTYLLATIGTRGRILVKNPPIDQLTALLVIIEQMGGTYEYTSEGMLINGKNAVKPVPFVETLPYPGFPTDLQSQLLSVLAIAEGNSTICENIFEARFKSALELKKMGARIAIEEKKVHVTGVKSLAGTIVSAEELRGGAALVIAGLIANKTTHVLNTQFINRGYENICKDLRSLGANIYERQEIQKENSNRN